MKWCEIVAENDIVDLSQKRKENQLNRFHGKFRSQVAFKKEQMKKAIDQARMAGWFEDFPIGSKYITPTGNSFEVTGHSMVSSKTNQVGKHEESIRKKFNFGPPAFFEVEDRFYRPRITVKQLPKDGDEVEVYETEVDLDKLLDSDGGSPPRPKVVPEDQKRYKKYTGPRPIK